MSEGDDLVRKIHHNCVKKRIRSSTKMELHEIGEKNIYIYKKHDLSYIIIIFIHSIKKLHKIHQIPYMTSPN